MRNSFNEFIIEYITKDFDLNINKLSNVQRLLLDDILEQVSEIFIDDIISKYPHLTSRISEIELIHLLQMDCTLLACLIYRIERNLFLSESEPNLLSSLANLMRTRTGIELYYSTQIGRGLNIQHGVGIVVGPRYVIGENFMIHQGVTLGQRKSAKEVIIIGDNVSVFAGAKILGNVIIGNNVKIAANAVLLTNADENCTYGGIPAKLISQR